MRALALWLPGALWLQVMASAPPLAHVERYTVVQPQRLRGPRERRALPLGSALYPESLRYLLQVEGSNFTLHLRKNRDLLGPRYAETYTADNGSEVTEQPQEQDHCLYQGHVEGHQHSAASVSTCDGLRGFFQVGSAVHLLEPLGGGGEEGPHALYQEKDLQPKARTCGVSDESLEDTLGPRTLATFKSRPPSRETRYVEIYVVTDSAEFQKAGSRDAVRRRVMEVVNHVDKLYQGLNFRVVLVGLEIWSGRDKFTVSSRSEDTLSAFLDWRARELALHQHDNVQLITGIDFVGTTVGLAKVSSMCTLNSGAVNQDHSDNPVGVASTMAHELGHNLGMDHDENIPGCYCAVPGRQGGCIMASSLSSVFPRTFSHCSVGDLEAFAGKPQAGCLENPPDPERLVGGPVCGNGFLERGEQCDCGRPEACDNPCCNATSCRLAEGAECAHGACCQGCKVKPAGELCRPPKDACDLEEFCDGQRPGCPEDAFQENGSPCPGGYCYDGRCPTLEQQCQKLWGPGAWRAPETCFAYHLPLACSSRILTRGPINKCGILFCMGGQKPPERGSCHVDHCNALLTESQTAYEAVPDGTRCGERKVCWRGRCEDLQVYRAQNCSAKCSSHGVCNHKTQCHCHQGWAPPYCAVLLADVQAASGSLPVGVLVALALLIGAVLLGIGIVVVRRRAQGGVQKRNMAPKAHLGLSNPLFHQGGGSVPAPTTGPPQPASATSRSRPPGPPASTRTPARPPPAPPASMSTPPPLVPIYSQQQPKQFGSVTSTKPPVELKPKQVVKPTFAPPMPPVKPGTGGSAPVPPQVALKPPVLRR
ncbi:disintegrin and metalloproteinase domain-containing protein 8 [Dasypus novemcinctus]|uniref:disintegrin and metalloproteinase domain-containing protein 8 n=1 Tax=Dasypus novemcinctus TaxID=9361 RepID=UPI00265D7A5A|nr:disintegrin and metalloproteinase domain-containing protein 8 [Dasypus novemcinctus]